MVDAEGLRVLEVRDELFGLILVRDLREEGPKARDRLRGKALLVVIDIVVKAGIGVPHEGVDTRLEREVLPFILEGKVLVVQNVPERGHIERIDREGGVEVDEIRGLLAGRVRHRRGGEGNLVKPVLLFKGRVDPGHVLLERGHDVLDTFLVRRFMKEVVFGPRKKGHPDAFGVVLGKDRIASHEVIFPADRARFLLMLIKEIEELVRVIVPVRVHEEKG